MTRPGKNRQEKTRQNKTRIDKRLDKTGEGGGGEREGERHESKVKHPGKKGTNNQRETNRHLLLYHHGVEVLLFEFVSVRVNSELRH